MPGSPSSKTSSSAGCLITRSSTSITTSRRWAWATPGAGTIVDVTACPGTDTCKLGISSSRGLAGELREQLSAKSVNLDAAIRGLRIKVSGCFNSCGQHHVADLGFYGNSRNINSYTVPHFQVMIGGKWLQNGGSYALAIGSIPSTNIPKVVDRLTDEYIKGPPGERNLPDLLHESRQEGFEVDDRGLVHVPPHAAAPEYYTDWGDPRAYTIGDMGMGECAGEVVSLAQFGFTQAETEAFESQLSAGRLSTIRRPTRWHTGRC